MHYTSFRTIAIIQHTPSALSSYFKSSFWPLCPEGGGLSESVLQCVHHFNNRPSILISSFTATRPLSSYFKSFFWPSCLEGGGLSERSIRLIGLFNKHLPASALAPSFQQFVGSRRILIAPCGLQVYKQETYSRDLYDFIGLFINHLPASAPSLSTTNSSALVVF